MERWRGGRHRPWALSDYKHMFWGPKEACERGSGGGTAIPRTVAHAGTSGHSTADASGLERVSKALLKCVGTRE